jgi:hypothetical protein
MARGGRRDGAGRKAGTPNKATAAKAAEVAASGLTPLDFMLNVVRDEGADPRARFEAAKAAAPYVHPRLSTISNEIDTSDPLKQLFAEVCGTAFRQHD